MFSAYRRATQDRALLNSVYRSVRHQHSLSSKGSALGSVAKLATGTVAVAGGAVGAAWYDPGLRKTMEQTAPPMKQLFTAVLGPPENEAVKSDDAPTSIETRGLARPTIIRQAESTITPKQGTEQAATQPVVSKVIEEVKSTDSILTSTQSVDDASVSISPTEVGVVDRKDQNTDLQTPLDVQTDIKNVETDTMVVDTQTPVMAEGKSTEEVVTMTTDDAVKEERAAQNAAFRQVLREIGEDAASTLTDSLSRIEEAITSTQAYCKSLKLAMSEDLESDKAWNLAEEARKLHPEVMNRAEQAILDAQQRLEKLAQAVQQGRNDALTASSTILDRAEDSVDDMKNALNEAVNLLKTTEGSLSEATDVLREKADTARESLLTELKAIAPSIADKTSVTEINDYLLAHAHLRLRQMRSRLIEQEKSIKERVAAQLEQQISERQLISSEKLESEVAELKSKQDDDKSRLLSEQQEQAEQELQKQLSRQAAAHQQHLRQTLLDQQEHLESRLDCALHEQAISQRTEFTREVGGSLARVRGIETALEAHVDQEAEVRKAQELWLSCVALNRVVHQGNDAAHDDQDTRKPLTAEVSSVVEAASKCAAEEKITDLLSSLPKQAVEEGVPTERELRYRFKQVHAVCRRVALLDEGDPRITRHFLSWLQSLLMFDRVSARSSDELVDPDEMSTFNKLASARYALTSGDLEQAVRFMTLLDGESGWVAADWLRDARLFLETRQTSDALEAQATASALGTLLGRGLPVQTSPSTEPQPPTTDPGVSTSDS